MQEPMREQWTAVTAAEPRPEDPHVMLWCAVLLQAVHDLGSDRRADRDSARHFFVSPASGFDDICEIVGLDAARARGALRPYILGRRRLKLTSYMHRQSVGRKPVDLTTVRHAERIIDEECSRVHAAPQDLRERRLPPVTAREVRRRIVERVYFSDRLPPMPRHFEVTNQILGRMIGTSKASVDCLRLRIRKGA